TGATVPLKKLVPGTSGTDETLDIKIPYRHTKGTISLRELDNVGNEGVPASLNVSVSFSDGDPYATTLGFTGSLTTGGTAIAGMNQDDAYPAAPVTLPFSFPFFGQNYSSVLPSTNGNLFFEPAAAPRRPNGEADDVPSSVTDLARFKMIS